ncbi:hypothetical protein OPT61_g6801 [Boeremia exigua]|uniref:Uncharacterized protein n=1 Tax=Boeremia exigua TaxID=749465 RepID=A0ACC2I5R0_9PLEO|nr:hypothetical protein OPT61_g6801 [Boeremia exigua]
MSNTDAAMSESRIRAMLRLMAYQQRHGQAQRRLQHEFPLSSQSLGDNILDTTSITERIQNSASRENIHVQDLSLGSQQATAVQEQAHLSSAESSQSSPPKSSMHIRPLVPVLPSTPYREQHEKEFERSWEYVRVQHKIVQAAMKYDTEFTAKFAYRCTRVCARIYSLPPHPLQALRLCYYMRSLGCDTYASIKGFQDPVSGCKTTMLYLLIANQDSEKRGLHLDHLYWVQNIGTGEALLEPFNLFRSNDSESSDDVESSQSSSQQQSDTVHMRGGAPEHPHPPILTIGRHDMPPPGQLTVLVQRMPGDADVAHVEQSLNASSNAELRVHRSWPQGPTDPSAVPHLRPASAPPEVPEDGAIHAFNSSDISAAPQYRATCISKRSHILKQLTMFWEPIGGIRNAAGRLREASALPPGDVLIHAGDLTNQGSYDELERTVAWLEKAPFEAKIVVAGNHEITLDEQFYEEKGSRWKWPTWQSPRGCMKLLRDSKTITYLENQSTVVSLKKPSGPQTCFRVFGSPSTPGNGNWAFEYQEQDAEKLWSAIPKDAQIVVTHTPPKGHCDAATKDDRSGCPALFQRLAVVRPLLHVCGHIHEARGVERVQWSDCHSDSLIESVEYWQDPANGNKKLSLLDLTHKSGRTVGNSMLTTRQSQSDSQHGVGAQPGLSMPEVGVLQPDQDNLKSTSSLIESALQGSEAYREIEDSGVLEQRRDGVVPRATDSGHKSRLSRSSRSSRYEGTAIVNAAFLGPRINGKTTGTNKPIVVDIDLPVCEEGNEYVQ